MVDILADVPLLPDVGLDVLETDVEQFEGPLDGVDLWKRQELNGCRVPSWSGGRERASVAVQSGHGGVGCDPDRRAPVKAVEREAGGVGRVGGREVVGDRLGWGDRQQVVVFDASGRVGTGVVRVVVV